MFHRKNNNNTTSKIDNVLKKPQVSVIAADVNFLGNIVSDGTIDLDGQMDGNVRCKVFTLRKNGRLNGDVTADIIHVFGKVVGTIRASEVNLYTSCHVEGLIMHESLTIEDGAFVDGQFKRADNVNTMVDDVADDDVDVFQRLQLIAG